MDTLKLAGRTILITGASRGIGQATAILLSRLGGRIVSVGRDHGRLEDTLARMEGAGHLAVTFDLNDIEQIPRWMKRIVAEVGPLYGLVHSAGIVMNRPLQVLSCANLADMQRINLEAAIMLTKGFRQNGVYEKGGTSIVYVSSAAAFKGKPALSAYCATKGALVAVARALARELAPEKIRINCVCPGLVETAMTAGLADILAPENLAQLHTEYPLGLGSPEDVAYAVAVLLSPMARWITGTSLVPDGGYSA